MSILTKLFGKPTKEEPKIGLIDHPANLRMQKRAADAARARHASDNIEVQLEGVRKSAAREDGFIQRTFR